MAATPATSLTLVSSGLADARQRSPLGNPNINQFVKVLKKTTRWAAQWNRVDFDGTPEFGTRVSMTLPRIGELVSGFTLAVTMPDIYTTQLNAIKAAGGTSMDASGAFLGPIFGWTNSLGHALIQQIEIEIGGTVVERFDGRLLEILDELCEPLEASVTKNAMIKRAPNNFNAKTWLTTTPLTVYVPIPFWFSRRGGYSHALPLEALAAEIVRVHVTFRPIADLFYTDARVNRATIGYRTGTDPVPPAMWPIQGARFWMSDPTAEETSRVYDMNKTMSPSGIPGRLIDGYAMPIRFSPVDAYALVEYISLEEYEALALRSAELTYHVEQHIAVPVTETLNTKEVRIALPYSNPTKEILWVAQRPEAAIYNAWFLFTRDLGPAVPPQATDSEKSPCAVPWWPDAIPIPTSNLKWQIKPAFQTAFSEPFLGATLLYNSYDRFVHEGASFFRGVIPSQYYSKFAIHNRYIYAYSFGRRYDTPYAPYAPRGAANWDKIPRKELFLTMAAGRGGVIQPSMNLYIYVTIWNVFKVYGGRGGMLFTN